MKHIFTKQNKALLSELVRTDFKLRYQNSVLGYAWSLLRPLLLFLILYLVFVKFIKIGNSAVALLFGIVLWNFFNEMTAQSVGSIVGRGDLIRKIKIPRWIIVASTSVSALINFCLTLVVISIFVALTHVHIGLSVLWLPLIFLEIYVFALGLSLFLAAAFVKYRDISYIWEVTLQLMFYMTPIIFPISLITNHTLQKLLFLNPMTQTIQAARYSLLSHNTVTASKVLGGWHQFIPIAIVLVTLLIGILYFRKESKYFAENI